MLCAYILLLMVQNTMVDDELCVRVWLQWSRNMPTPVDQVRTFSTHPNTSMPNSTTKYSTSSSTLKYEPKRRVGHSRNMHVIGQAYLPKRAQRKALKHNNNTQQQHDKGVCVCIVVCIIPRLLVRTARHTLNPVYYYVHACVSM